MNITEAIKQLTLKDTSIATLFFLSVVGPGILILYLFKPNLLVSLDVVKVIFLSTSFTLPIVAINSSVISYATHIRKVRQREQFVDAERLVTYVIGMAVSFCVLYIALLITYIAGLPFKSFLLFIASFQFMALIFEYRAVRKAQAIPIKN
jgi:hypothetical protein